MRKNRFCSAKSVLAESADLNIAQTAILSSREAFIQGNPDLVIVHESFSYLYNTDMVVYSAIWDYTVATPQSNEN